MGKYYGINNYSEHPKDYSWDPRRGPSLISKFVGPVGVIDGLLFGGGGVMAFRKRFHKTIRPDGGYATAEVFTGAEDSQPAGEPLADLWDLDGNDIEKSLWEKPAIKAMFEVLWDTDGSTGLKFPSQGYLDIRKDILDMVAGQKTITDVTWWNSGATPLLMKVFIGELMRGVETYWMSHWVLRHRVIIARASLTTIRPEYRNVDKIFASTSDLGNLESMPSIVFEELPLPEGVWLKKSPRRDQIASDKWQITQEYYWADDYSNVAYDPAS
jgi:hypothetical protein